MKDYENLRTLDEFRELIANETDTLRAIGWTEDQIGRWLAGARWAVRIARIMEREKVGA